MKAWLADGDGFGEGSWLIDFAAEVEGAVVGEELSGEELDYDVGGGVVLVWEWDVVGEVLQVVVGEAGGSDADDGAATGGDFADAGEGGVESFRVGGFGGEEGDGVEVFVDEGDGAVFEESGCHAFGVAVGDFFEFEG